MADSLRLTSIMNYSMMTPTVPRGPGDPEGELTTSIFIIPAAAASFRIPPVLNLILTCLPKPRLPNQGITSAVTPRTHYLTFL